MLTFSNSHLWANCAASVHPHPVPVPVEFERTDAQLEGEAAAWLAEQILRGDTGKPINVGDIAPNGWPIDREMIRHVGSYVELVQRHGQVEPEHDLKLWNGLVRGRPDAHTVSLEDILRVYDLKYGHRIVEPHNNTALLLAAMALWQPHHRIISLEIFQPRAAHANGPHRKWVINADELQDWDVSLYRAAIATLDARPIASVGSQCEFCHRRAACHALASAVYRDTDQIRSEHRARALEAQEIADELTFLEGAMKRLEARHSGIRTEVQARMRAGEFIPGRCLDAKYGNRAFTVDTQVIRVLTGLAPTKEVLRTPADLEKEGANPDVIAQICRRPFIGMEMKTWDEKKIAKVFDKGD